MRTFRCEIAYDGSRFFGWQRQDGFLSVQQALEEALESLLGVVTSVQAAGRTDTGVHALAQVAHFHVATRLDDDRLRHALNAHLRPGVQVLRLEACRADFHARFDARGKRYVYLMATTRFRPVFNLEHVLWVKSPLDLEAMRAASGRLVGTHDFKAFGNAGSVRKTTVRTVSRVRLRARHQSLALLVEGDGFLYNMVRTIVGTLLDVGRNKLTADDVAAALASKDRSLAGPTAPARGLYLARVLYSESVFSGRDRGPNGTPGAFQY
jgi:tRNA pseudouridine38-40 synthase